MNADSRKITLIYITLLILAIVYYSFYTGPKYINSPYSYIGNHYWLFIAALHHEPNSKYFLA